MGAVLGNPKQLEIQRTSGQPGQPPQHQQPPPHNTYPPPQQNTYPHQQQQNAFQTSSGGMPQNHAQHPMKQETGVGAGSTNTYQPGGTPRTPTQRGTFGNKHQVSPPSQRNIFPIASLNPFQGRWTIRARVMAKPPMRSYSNSRGEGKIMSIDLVDESVSTLHMNAYTYMYVNSSICG